MTGNILKNILFGFIIGIANIIPGVSGGTFALILGIYPRLIQALGVYDAGFVKEALTRLKYRQLKSLKMLVLTDHFYFLVWLTLGSGLSILLLSQVIKYCLESHYEATYGFFFGLIVFSIPIPYRMLERKTPKTALWCLIGIGLTLLISIQVDPSVKLLEKSRHYQLILEGSREAALAGFALGEYLSVFLVGMMAISAMVLPGISGSFVLLLFGKYYQVIATISRLRHAYPEDILFLVVFGMGILAGLVVFVKLFNYVYGRFKDQTIFFLVGLMLGSLYALWPFKEYQVADLYMKINNAIVNVPGCKVYGNSLRLWGRPEDLVPVFATFLVGSAIMLFFNRYEKAGGAM